MANLLKALFISSLMSGTFLTNAMDSSHRDFEDARLASLYGMSSVEEYRQSPFYEHQYVKISTTPLKQTDEQLAKELGISVEELRTARIHEQQRNQSYQTTINSNQQSQAINTASTTSDEDLAKQLGISVEVLRIARMQEQQRNQRSQPNTYSSTAERKRKEEEATQVYLRKMKEEEQTAAFFRQEEASQKSISNFQYDDYMYEQNPSLIFQVNQMSHNFAVGKHRPVLDHFMRIFEYLKTVDQHSDVHVLDNYVFGGQNNIQHLVNIGKLYNIDNPDLSLANVGQQMVKFINEHRNLFSNFKYNNNPVSNENMIAYLYSHFSNMDNEISMCPAAREIWSRAWTLALKLHNENGNFKPLQIIFDQAIEGHMTRGGCIQGRIDRGFVGYVILLGNAGVGIFH